MVFFNLSSINPERKNKNCVLQKDGLVCECSENGWRLKPEMIINPELTRNILPVGGTAPIFFRSNGTTILRKGISLISTHAEMRRNKVRGKRVIGKFI